MITGIVGPPRHGKSTLGNIFARQRIDYYEKVGKDRPIYCNYPIHHPKVIHYTSFDNEIMGLYDCDVIVDEFANLFGRRDHKATDEDLSFFRQHGHDGLNIIWIAHHILDVDTKIAEELTESIWDVRRMWGPNRYGDPTPREAKWGWRTRATQYEARTYSLITKRERLDSFTFDIQEHIHEYDSFYMVGLRDGTGARAGRTRRDSDAPEQRWLHEDMYHGSRHIEFNQHGNTSYVEWRPTLASLNGLNVQGEHQTQERIDIPVIAQRDEKPKFRITKSA